MRINIHVGFLILWRYYSISSNLVFYYNGHYVENSWQ
jgi:hypothetical protein